MQNISVWDIQVWDGGGGTDHKYYVATKKAADEWKRNNTYDYICEKTITIYDSYEDLMVHVSNEAKEKALAKLTKEDRIALGLIENAEEKKVCENKVNGYCQNHNLQCYYPDYEK